MTNDQPKTPDDDAHDTMDRFLRDVRDGFECVNDRPMSQAEAQFVDCFVVALTAAMPAFFDAFLRCIGGGGRGDYCPGDRDRC